MKKRGAVELPFNWMFAIIVGIIILFIAIYATSKYMGVSEYKVSTETAAHLTNLLSTTETGLASGKSAQINFKKDTRTYYECSDLGVWGKDKVAFSEKTFGDWGEKGGAVDTQKYVFAENMIESRQLNLFSKPFSMPFKIDDIIVISGRDYCFIGAPNPVEDEVLGLNIKNINFADTVGDVNCTGVNVCFGEPFENDCEIKVSGMCEDYTCESNYDYGKVFRGSDILYYTDSLLYAAIISDVENYDCNLKRLMKRFVSLSDIYIDKIKIIELQGCSSTIEADLNIMKNSARDLETSLDLFSLADQANKIDLQNQGAVCKVY